ncbi:hypothetical protein CAter10_2048 [Collimonas arenae]|nr:hypothetical protein CAter10_2048 [Collimonas arenae]
MPHQAKERNGPLAWQTDKTLQTLFLSFQLRGRATTMHAQ